ncbi:MAG: protein-S-isoprenylcysteine O-methyltransferase [Pseudomonadota bacterium]
MTASSSEVSTADLLKRLAVPIVFAVVLVTAAAWQGRLTLGVGLFLALVFSMSVTRIMATRGEPLPIKAAFAPTREKWLVTVVALGMVWLPIVAIATPFLDFAAYTPPLPAIAIGVLISIIALWLFYRSHTDLGAYWSPVLEIRENHALVTDGVYRRMRHPMYTAIFLWTCAQALILGNWIAGPSGMITFIILYAIRVGPEEKMMVETFGDEYRDYCRRTGRLLPKLTS